MGQPVQGFGWPVTFGRETGYGAPTQRPVERTSLEPSLVFGDGHQPFQGVFLTDNRALQPLPGKRDHPDFTLPAIPYRRSVHQEEPANWTDEAISPPDYSDSLV